MSHRSSHGNLTATLVVVAFLELVVDRLLGRLFLAPGCQGGVGCLLLRTGPFLLHLAGALTLVVAAGGIFGHLRRGELFPRGMRLTIAVLSAIFLLLLALSLLFGRIPERYHIHLETSFAFVVGLLVLSFIGADAVPIRPRIGFLLFALPPLLHVSALVAARAGWLNHGAVSPDRLTSMGEMILLLAAASAPLLLLPSSLPRGRLAAGLALAAGVSAFFFVAYLARTDLVQTLAVYSLQLELPRALSGLGALYVIALFGFVATVAVLLLSPGAGRLAGLGMCLVGLAGYQTSSPVALGLSLCGLVALATGTVRAGRSVVTRDAPLSTTQWQSLLEAIAAALADPPSSGTEPTVIDAAANEGDVPAPDKDLRIVRLCRRGRLVELKLRREHAVVRGLEATVGTPEATPPEAVIESHEAWLGRRPEERVSLPRVKTGDAAFDRKLGVHGRAPVGEPELRRRLLRLSSGTITLWIGQAAHFVAPANPAADLRQFSLSATPASVDTVKDMVDTLIALLDAADEQTAPPDAAQ